VDAGDLRHAVAAPSQQHHVRAQGHPPHRLLADPFDLLPLVVCQVDANHAASYLPLVVVAITIVVVMVVVVRAAVVVVMVVVIAVPMMAEVAVVMTWIDGMGVLRLPNQRRRDR
jgi:hypothetical protein